MFSSFILVGVLFLFSSDINNPLIFLVLGGCNLSCIYFCLQIHAKLHDMLYQDILEYQNPLLWLLSPPLTTSYSLCVITSIFLSTTLWIRYCNGLHSFTFFLNSYFNNVCIIFSILFFWDFIYPNITKCTPQRIIFN